MRARSVYGRRPATRPLSHRDAAFLAGLQTMDPRDLVLLDKLLPDGEALRAIGLEGGEKGRAPELWAMVMGAALAAGAGLACGGDCQACEEEPHG